MKQESDCSIAWVTWSYCQNACTENGCLAIPENIESPAEETESIPTEETGLGLQQTFGFPILILMLLATAIFSIAYYRILPEYKSRLAPESF